MCAHVLWSSRPLFKHVFNLVLGTDYFNSPTPPCGKTTCHVICLIMKSEEVNELAVFPELCSEKRV